MKIASCRTSSIYHDGVSCLQLPRCFHWILHGEELQIIVCHSCCINCSNDPPWSEGLALWYGSQSYCFHVNRNCLLGCPAIHEFASRRWPQNFRIKAVGNKESQTFCQCIHSSHISHTKVKKTPLVDGTSGTLLVNLGQLIVGLKLYVVQTYC